MNILIFIIILSVLIIVHELGHFLAAKKFGIRVDEFGLGYPPKAARLFRWRGTDFTLNWLPFGGFVKIFGENPAELDDSAESSNLHALPGQAGLRRDSDLEDSAPSDNFQHKNRGIQAAVLAGGVFFNFVFAWLLISIGFMSGLPAPAGSFPVENARTVITTVLPDSPAARAGIRSGDALVSLSRGGVQSELSPEVASSFIGESSAPLVVELERGGEIREVTVDPVEGIVAGKPAVGVSMDLIGTVSLNPASALWHGLLTSTELTWLTAKALGGFLVGAVTGEADLSQVTGPVGIVGMVGDVQELGFVYLLSFTALISINLAIINLIPFPALDGGRLLFVAIEAIRRKAIPARIFNIVNTIGFTLLIFLMIVITFRDVRNIL